MSRAILLLAALVVLTCGGSTLANDDAKAEAKEHFESGVELMKTEDFESAVAEFERSTELYPSKTGLYNLANCYKGLHRYGKALTTIRRLRRDFGDALTGELKREVAAFERTLEGMVGSLTVTVDRDGATVLVDGEDVGVSPLAGPLLLSPGTHQVSVSLDGHTYEEQEVKLLARDERALSFVAAPVAADETPEPADEAPVTDEVDDDSGGPSPLFWTGAASTVVAGALTGVFFGLRGRAEDDFDSARGQWDQLSEAEQASSTGDGPWNAMQTASDDYDAFNTAAMISAISAGVFAVSSVVILITDLGGGDESEEPESAAQVHPTPGGLVVAF